MASWSKHTWYTTFRRQRVLFWFGFPSIFIRRNRDEFQGGLPGARHRSHSPASCLATLGGLERWAWESLERARGPWGLEANLYPVLPTGAQNSNEGTLPCGGGGRGLAWWCHDMVLAWIIKDSHLRNHHVAARRGQSASYRRAFAQVHRQ